MKYGIVENNKFLLIDNELQRLKNTLLFMPQYSKDQIRTYAEDEIEQGSDGQWYEKGFMPERPLEEAKAIKLSELGTAFEEAFRTAYCHSAIGFDINANETASRNVANLIVAMEASGERFVRFCSCDNTFHEITLDQLKTIQLEIIANVRALYQKKWALREQIDAAETLDDVKAVEIGFERKNEIDRPTHSLKKEWRYRDVEWMR